MAELPSPKTPIATELSDMEEGKTSPQGSLVNFESPTYTHKIIAELVGTYILIFIGCGSILVDKKHNITIMGIAVAWGLAVMVLVYSLGHVSGAHFNPAVTIAFSASRRFPWKHVPSYVASQVLGSTLATLTLKALFTNQFVDKQFIGATVTGFSRPTYDLDAIAWEFIVSFILMFVVCGVATDHRAIHELSGVAVGSTVLFDILVAGKTTGASMNPARSIGPALVSGEFHQLWIYIVAPILGTTAATMMYSLLRVPMPDKESTKSV